MIEFHLSIIIARIFILIINGAILLRIWLKSSKRYFTDFPFWFALTFFTLGISKLIDFYIGFVSNDMDSTNQLLFILKFRYFFFALTVGELIMVLLIIWFKNKRSVQVSILSLYSILWFFIIIYSRDYESLTKSSSIILLPAIIFIIFTFLFIYRQKRLPKFHALYVAVGTIIYTISQILRPFMVRIGDTKWGLMWVCEIIDLAAWLIIFLGFIIKPNYYNVNKLS
ncbi:MAG: hypothetical protein ACTSXU_06155 [Promethearchaeota archaeon]